MATNTIQALRFERKTCSRCGGSGEYSYNQMTGSRCFKCNGNKQVLTAKGLRQHAAFMAKSEVLIENVKVGDKVDCGSLIFTVVAVELKEKCSGARVNNGPIVWSDAIALISASGSGYQAEPGHKMNLVFDKETRTKHLREAIETTK